MGWGVSYGYVGKGDGDGVSVSIQQLGAHKVPECAIVCADVIQNPGAYIRPDDASYRFIDKLAI